MVTPVLDAQSLGLTRLLVFRLSLGAGGDGRIRKARAAQTIVPVSVFRAWIASHDPGGRVAFEDRCDHFVAVAVAVNMDIAGRRVGLQVVIVLANMPLGAGPFPRALHNDIACPIMKRTIRRKQGGLLRLTVALINRKRIDTGFRDVSP